MLLITMFDILKMSVLEQEKFEDTTGAIINCKSKRTRQYNGQTRNDKNDLQDTSRSSNFATEMCFTKKYLSLLKDMYMEGPSWP